MTPLEAWQEQHACKVCGNRPNEEGEIQHGKGCYTQSADGGGWSTVECDSHPMPVAELVKESSK